MNWTDLSRHDVGAWVDTILKRSPLPIWQLAESAPHPNFERLGARSLQLREPRKDSGVWELFMRESEHFVRGALSESVPRAIEEAAQQIDRRRTYVQQALSDSHVIVAEYSSFLDSGAPSVGQVEYEAVPVVGPGGRLTVYRTSRNGERGWLQADLVVRPTTKPISSSWRRASEILREWEIRYSEAPEPLKVSVAFGYFELSKYERQTWLRPAFVFDVGHPGSERSVAWQQSLVLPATMSSEISLNEGFGSWAQ